MAEANSLLNIIVRLHDEASTQLQAFGGRLKELEPQFKTMRNVGVAGFAAIAAGAGLAIAEALDAEAAFNRLNHILKTSRGATDAQVDSLVKQAKALEQVGVVSQSNVIAAQSQLATFDLSAAAIGRLTPAILDYVVAEKGANASTEDLKQLTNGLAQALQGNFASLTKTGFVLDDATKELIKTGTETERTTALVKVLNSTYDGFNTAARNTAEGGLIVLKNEMNNVRQAIGEALLPILIALVKAITPLLTKATEWIENHKELAAGIVIVSGVIFAMLAVLGTLGLIIPGIITAFSFLGATIAAISGTIGIVIVAILALGAWFVWLWNNSDKVANGMKEVWLAFAGFFVEIWERVKLNFSEIWEGIKDIFNGAIAWMMEKLQPLLNAIAAVRDGFKSVTGTVGKQFGAAGTILSQNIGAAARAIGFANGGVVTGPTFAMVGEAGPEAIIPLDQMGRMGGITLNIYGDVSGEELIEKVKHGLMRSLRFDTKIGL